VTKSLLVKDAIIGLKSLGLSREDINLFFRHMSEEPDEWPLVEEVLLRRCQRGELRVGGMGFVDDLRREGKKVRRGEFLFNNNWSPYYARLFALKYPEFRDRFEFRKLRAAA